MTNTDPTTPSTAEEETLSTLLAIIRERDDALGNLPFVVGAGGQLGRPFTAAENDRRMLLHVVDRLLTERKLLRDNLARERELVRHIVQTVHQAHHEGPQVGCPKTLCSGALRPMTG